MSCPRQPARTRTPLINAIRQYVFSSTPESADWNNSTIIRDDVVTAVTELKQQDGRDLIIYGHGRLSRTLLENYLVDEIRFSVHAVLVGGRAVTARDLIPARAEFLPAGEMDRVGRLLARKCRVDRVAGRPVRVELAGAAFTAVRHRDVTTYVPRSVGTSRVGGAARGWSEQADQGPAGRRCDGLHRR